MPPTRHVTIGMPAVFPVPRSVVPHGEAVQLADAVALVALANADQPTLRVVRQILRDAGVSRVDQVGDLAALPGDEPAVLIDERAGDLPPGGYLLAVGHQGDRGVIELSGRDGSGTFYAAQTLRQLRVGDVIPGGTVRDWPSYPVRGVIEGFYGVPWTQQARLDQLDFYGRHKLNAYVYSPKNDPYLRDRWRDAYPADVLARLRDLVARAAANHVAFTYALSPGLSVCYGSAVDESALLAKLQAMWDIGVRSFMIPLDDIDISGWHCPLDAAMFGSGDAAEAAAQAHLLNAVQRDFIATHHGAARLAMVPTEYHDVAASPYKDSLSSTLDPAVIVEWTGVGVIAPTITPTDIAAAHAAYRHDILVWDNYPVNDYIPNRLLLGPYTGRPDVSTGLVGVTANPMPQAEASKIAEFTLADYLWNSPAYQPARAYNAALTELSGGDRSAAAALAAFTDLEYDSALDKGPAPALAARIATFTQAWQQGDLMAMGQLDDYLALIESAPSSIRDRSLLVECQPWLGAATAWADAARSALRLLDDRRRDDRAAGARDRDKIDAQLSQAGSFTYTGLGAPIPVTVGHGVLDRFVEQTLSATDRWLSPDASLPAAVTSLDQYQNQSADLMVDGDVGTYFSSDAPPAPGDYVGVDRGSPRPVSSVWISMGTPDSPNDYIHTGVLEYSADGATWQQAATVQNDAQPVVTFPAGTTARYVRLRSTDTQDFWVAVNEFTVH